MIKVLFVCTGNVFRSLTAEKCLKDYIDKHNIKNIEVDSAGTNPIHYLIQEYSNARKMILKRLNFHNIEFKHKYKKINQKLVDNNDIVIAMNTNHQEYILNKFGIEVPLFNEIAHDKSEGVLDVGEIYPGFKNIPSQEKKMNEHIDYTIDYIYYSTPKLFAGIKKRMIKTYLFDLDGTLIDSCVYKNSYVSIINKIKEIKTWDDKTLDKFAQENNIKKSEWGYDTGDLCKILGLLDIYYEILENEIKKGVNLKFDVKEKFKELKEKGIKICICSNSMRKTIKMQLDAHDVKDYDFIFSSEDAKVRKDNKEYWQALIKEHNLIPEECLVIGDDEVGDKLVPNYLGFNIKMINEFKK